MCFFVLCNYLIKTTANTAFVVPKIRTELGKKLFSAPLMLLLI